MPLSFRSIHRKGLAQKNIPVGVIPMVDYGMMNGPQVLALAEELIGE